MEKLLDTLWAEIYPFLNMGYILLLILSANVLINKAQIHKNVKWFWLEGHTVYAVLLLAFIISIPWGVVYLYEHRPFSDHFKLIISYCVATSIYEVFISKFLNDGKKA